MKNSRFVLGDHGSLSHRKAYTPQLKPAVSVVAALPTPTQAKSELLEAISLTDNGKSATPEVQLRVLELVRSLETKFPPSSDILSDPKEAQILDGTWYV